MTSSATSQPASDLKQFNRGSRAVVIGEWILLLFLLGLFAVHGFVPAWRSLNSDFPNYYLAALLHRQGIPLDRAYEWTWFQRQNDHFGVRDGIVAFAPNPPMCALPFLPLAKFPPLTAKRTWLVVNLALLGLALGLLHRATALSWRRVALISLLCVVPLHANFLLGQYYVLLLLLICAAYYAYRFGHQWTAGLLLGAAAALKLFPAVFFILFLAKRKWRGAAGMICGGLALGAISVVLFGWEVHRVFLFEVLPQVNRGEWLAPYDLSRNSFNTLWSHLFVFEPELNPSPWIASPALYAIVQAVTVTITLFSFLLSLDQRETRRVEAIQWSLLVLLALLLSSTTGIYHPTVLIFTAVVAGDALLVEFDKNRALLVMLLFVIACAYVPANVARFFPLSRLAAMTALYVLLIHAALAGQRVAVLRWMPAALVVVTLLTLGNLRFVVNRAEDYQRRLASPWAGYGSANPVPLANGIAFRAMQQKGYIVQVLQNGELTHVFGKGNMLSLSAAKSSAFLYLEIAAQKSFITRLPVSRLGGAAETQTPGQDPALSPDGRWLAFIREDGGQSSAWLLATDMRNAPQPVLLSSYHPLDLTVSSNGDLIASAGPVSESYLVVVRRATQKVELLRGISRPARYPSVSPDSERLAYSRRDHGFWHLIVHDFATGAERQLTHGACNAISASWQDDETLLYATDCGRGVGLSAVAQVHIPQ